MDSISHHKDATTAFNRTVTLIDGEAGYLPYPDQHDAGEEVARLQRRINAVQRQLTALTDELDNLLVAVERLQGEG